MCETKTEAQIVATCTSTCKNFDRCAARLLALDSVPLPRPLFRKTRQGPSAISLSPSLEHRDGAMTTRARTYPFLIAENA